jgi:MFS family permease
VLGDLRGRALAVVIGALVCQLGLGFGYTLSALAPPMLAEFGWSRTEWSGARLPQLAVLALASPPVGFLAARWGSRAVLLAAVALFGLVFGLLARIQGLLDLYLLVALMGLPLVGVGDIAAGQMVMNWVQRRRGLALGIVYSGSNLGGSLFIGLATWLTGRGSWRDAYLGLALVALAVMLPVAALTLRERAPLVSPPGRPSDPRRDDAPAAAGAAAGDGDLSLRAALRTRSFWILGFSLFTFFFFFLGRLDHLVLFLTDAGMPLADANGWYRAAVGLGVLSKVGFGWVADRLPRKRAALLDYGLLALSSLLLLALPREAFLWPFVLAWGLATAARDVVTPLLVGHCFGTRYMAEIYGALMLTLMLGGVGGPLFAGWVHDRLGGYAPAFAVFAALNVAAVVALAFLRRERATEAA